MATLFDMIHTLVWFFCCKWCERCYVSNYILTAIRIPALYRGKKSLDKTLSLIRVPQFSQWCSNDFYGLIYAVLKPPFANSIQTNTDIKMHQRNIPFLFCQYWQNRIMQHAKCQIDQLKTISLTFKKPPWVLNKDVDCQSMKWLIKFYKHLHFRETGDFDSAVITAWIR